jgi:hypothetical protein
MPERSKGMRKELMKYRCIDVPGFSTSPIDPSNCPEVVMELYVVSITASVLFGQKIPECVCRLGEDRLLMVFESHADTTKVLPNLKREGVGTIRLDTFDNCVIVHR